MRYPIGVRFFGSSAGNYERSPNKAVQATPRGGVPDFWSFDDMSTVVHFAIIFAGMVILTTGCHQNTPPSPSPSADWWAGTSSPALALWDGATYLAGTPPSVIFAVWPDGVMVRSVDGRLLQGLLSVQELRSLMAEVEAAGFFGPALPHHLARPDGPVRCLAAMRSGKLVCSVYDGYRDFDSGPHASHSRQQMEAFIQMWQRVVHAIDAVTTGQLQEYRGERELRYPDC